jgi:hypothetical protein
MNKQIKFLLIAMIFLVLTSTASAATADWWDYDWQYRQKINITQNDAIPNNYTIEISLNTSLLVEEGKLLANGSDLRVVYYNGSDNTEIDRFNTTAFNNSKTKVRFKINNKSNSEYFIYYANPLAGAAPQDRTKIYYYFEDFEDQAHELTNGPLAPTVNTGSKKNGNYGLEGDGVAGYRRAVKPEVLPRGYILEGWVYSGYAGDNADLPGLAFGMQPSGDQKNGYQVVLDWRSTSGGSADMQIRENYGSGSPLATSTANTVTADTWYYIKVIWRNNGQINATIYNSAMTVWGTLLATDPSYSSGYYGVAAYRDGFWDDVTLRLFIDNAPIIFLETEEAGGPIISQPEVNASTIDRNEFIEISANITTEKIMDSAWTEITLPNSTKQNYTMSNTSSIYSLVYQSTEIGEHTAKIYANDTEGTTTSSSELTWEVFGYAEINQSNLNPVNITQGQTTQVSCQVTDAYTLDAIANYIISFYSNNTGFLGNNQTNSSGWAILSFTSYDIGSETITCIITSNQTLYYNVTTNNQQNQTLNVSEAPQLLIVSTGINTNLSGIGSVLNISAEITAPNPIDKVLAKVTFPSGSSNLFELTNTIDTEFILEFNQTFAPGNYSFYIIANDTSGDEKNSSEESINFTITSQLTISLDTDKDSYGLNQTVSLSTSVSNWWNENWNDRKQVTITNEDSSILRKDYSINLTFNVGNLISQGLVRNDCKDLRVVYYNGQNHIELDRTNETTCSGVTEIWFPLQANISASGSDSNYYIYYNNPSAGSPPQNRSEIYLVWDDFESYSIDSTPGGGWTEDPEFSTHNWQIKSDSGNKVLQDISPDGEYKRLYQGESWWTNYKIEARVKLDSFLFSGITFRRQPWSGSYYDHYALITDDRAANNKLVIRRWSGGGSNFAVVASDSTDFDGLAWHSYTIDIIGDSISLSRDGTQYVSHDISGDTPRFTTGGHVGLMSHEGLTMFDDVKVRLLLENEPTTSLGEQEQNAVSSIIENSGSEDAFGYLIMKIEKNNSGSWDDFETILDDTLTLNKRTIPSSSTLDITSIWNALGSYTTNESGMFRATIQLVDPSGTILLNDSSEQVALSAEFTAEGSGPNVTLISPIQNAGSNGNITQFTYNVTDESGIDSCDLIVDDSTLATSTNINNGELNALSTSELSLGNHLWEIRCYDVNNNPGNSEERTITIVPSYDYGGQTTDLSQVDVNNIPNLVIEEPSYGLINFSESINLSGGANINQYVTISHNLISIDSNNLPQLNKSATLTLYNLSFQNPVILKNDKACQDCEVLTYTADRNLTFTVQSFSNYSASENSQLEIFDSTDNIRSFNSEVSFYANFTNTTSSSAISSGTCNIDFTDISDTMTFNSTSGLFEYNRMLAVGVHYYNVSCYATGYTTLNTTDNANIDSIENPNGANVTVISSERASSDNPENTTAYAGNITSVDISGRSTTQSWQGYFGNVTGTIQLEGANGSVFYNWSASSPSGEVYATRAQEINFATIACASQQTIINEESFIGQNSNDSDSVTNTFNSNLHPEFFVGKNQISANSCNATNIFGPSGEQSTSFFEVLLADGAQNIVYTSILEQDTPGFNSRPHDFQMIVGENGHGTDTETTSYYFYVELH